ncbi:MAG: chromate transporter [Verrucomicrobia bacterium]|nr:chromate transporter [Verrucomicrobiota bacterium]
MTGKPERARLLELFFVFARISSITIGGGYVMFPMLKSEVVDSKGWLSDEELVDYYALGQSIPGIIAINTSTLIGYRKRGIPGAIAAAAGMAMPSLVVILLISAFFVRYLDNAWVQKAFAGIRAAVVAMIVMAVWNVGKKSVTTPTKAVIAAGSFLAIVGLQWSPILLIISGAVLGLLLFQREVEA